MNVMIFGNGKSVNPSNNQYFWNDGTYNRSDNTLYGPGEQVWTEIKSDADVQSIIAHKLNGDS